MDVKSLEYLPLLTLQLLLISSVCGQYIRFEDGGYSGIFVSIHKDVPENADLVHKIKNVFTSASRFLAQATHERAYFKEITIEVPATWSSKPTYDHVPGQSQFTRANFRIANQNPQFKDTPYTLQPSGCGEPGQFVHLTPSFILNTNNAISKTFGNLSKQVVHEWAHLRYGVFDEYGEAGSDKYPSFYIDDNGDVRPTSCKDNINGWLSSSDGGPCTILEGQLLPDDDCMFIPDPDKNNATSSIMYSPFLPSIEQFCDNDNKTLHNTNAPNKHNNLCNYKPTWEIISLHKDFIGQLKTNVKNTKPTFRVIHRKKNQKTRYILSLDVSGSMRSFDRILTLREAASRFIYHRLRNGDYLGLLSFSKQVEQLLAVTIVNDATKDLMQQTLPKETYSETAIGQALLESIQMFKRSGLSPEGAVVILITDGEENQHPSITAVLKDVVESKMIVNTIAIGTKASQRLELLSKQTGGKVFYVPDKTTNPTLLDEAFLTLASDHSQDEAENIMILSDSFHVGGGEVLKKTAIIDESVGNNTQFLFSGKDIDALQISVVSPSGTLHSTEGRNAAVHPVSRSVVFNIPDAEAGVWKYIVKNEESPSRRSIKNVDVTLTSGPRQQEEPVRIKTWIKNSEVVFPSGVVVYAHVYRAFTAVIQADVMAFITGPDGQRFNVTLLDDGSGPDINKDDGIYSAYFAGYTGNGRYSVTVRAENIGQAVMLQRHAVSRAPAIPNIPNFDKIKEKPSQRSFPINQFIIRRTDSRVTSINSVPASIFQRTSMVGSFKLTAWNNVTVNWVRPIRVTDLKASYVSTDENFKTVRLEWTVPEDEEYSNKDTSVDIRASWSHSLLLKKFKQGYKLNTSDVVQGKFSETPFTMNDVTFKVPSIQVPNDGENEMNLYFSLQYVDAVNNAARTSNIAYVTFGVNRVRLEEPALLESDDMPKIVGIVAGCIIGSLFFILAFVFAVRHCKKSADPVDDV